MPNPAMSALSSDSTPEQIQDAISEEIRLCMLETPPEGAGNQQKYCAGKAYGMARSATGKELNAGRIR